MVYKNLFIPVLRTKVASELEGLVIHWYLERVMIEEPKLLNPLMLTAAKAASQFY